MRNTIRIMLLLFVVGLASLPQLAQARAGSGSSMGSRGSNTYSASPSYNAAPIQRSTTTSQPSSGYSQPGYGAAAPAGGGSFMRSVAGGFLGAGMANMLFGHGGGYGEGGGGSGLFSLLLLAGIGYFLYRRFGNGNFNSGGAYMNPLNSNPGNAMSPFSTVTQLPDNKQSLAVNDSDKAAFGQLLIQIQQCWSEGDLTKMRQFVTPEMLHYFSEELSANSSKGLANMVEQVQVQQADVVESWREYNLDYATASMKWTALDTMVRLDRKPGDSDYIASGDAHQPVPAQEFWTFARADGGHWLLSAIQQVG